MSLLIIAIYELLLLLITTDELLLMTMYELLLLLITMVELLIMILYETSNISAQKLLLNNKFLSYFISIVYPRAIWEYYNVINVHEI